MSLQGLILESENNQFVMFRASNFSFDLSIRLLHLAHRQIK